MSNSCKLFITKVVQQHDMGACPKRLHSTGSQCLSKFIKCLAQSLLTQKMLRGNTGQMYVCIHAFGIK